MGFFYLKMHVNACGCENIIGLLFSFQGNLETFSCLASIQKKQEHKKRQIHSLIQRKLNIHSFN